MAKKAAKKVSSAKAKAKPAAKATAKAAKLAKTAKPAAKTPAKSTPVKKAASVSKPAKAAKSQKTEKKPEKLQKVAIATKLAKESDSEAAPEAPVLKLEKTPKAEKPPKTEKAPKVEKKLKSEKALMKVQAGEEGSRWADLHQKYKSEKPQVYNMTAQFDANKPIQHKVLGWGFVLSNENDRLEVLFEQGIKMLISNYKSS